MEEKAQKESIARNSGQSQTASDEIWQSARHRQVRADNEVVYELRENALYYYWTRASVRLPALRA